MKPKKGQLYRITHNSWYRVLPAHKLVFIVAGELVVCLVEENEHNDCVFLCGDRKIVVDVNICLDKCMEKV